MKKGPVKLMGHEGDSQRIATMATAKARREANHQFTAVDCQAFNNQPGTKRSFSTGEIRRKAFAAVQEKF